MFDLFRSRDKAVKILLGALLVLVALSMVTYLIPSVGDPALSNSTNPVLAQIGDYKLTAQEAQQQMQRMAQGQIPPELLGVYFPQVLDQMIQQRAALLKAQEIGIRVTDQEIATQMNAILPDYFQNGKLTNRAGLEAVLAQQGMNAAQLIDQLRDQITLRKLQDAVLDSIVIAPQEIEAEYRNKHERASVSYVALTNANFRAKATVTDEEVRKRYDATKTNYMQPAKYNFRVAILDQSKLESSVQVNEAEVRAAYNASLDNFRTGDRVHARHILVSTENKSDSEKAQLKTKAENLLKQAKAGGDFAELARNNSDDPGSASQGGDLGTFGRGAMVEAFDAVAFALKPNEISNLVETQFGYHIIQTLEKEPARIRPFEEVRAPLEQQLKSEKVVETMQTSAEAMRAELSKTPAQAAQIANKYMAELVAVDSMAAGDPIPTLGVSPEITTALRDLQAGGISGVLPLPSERLAVAILDSKIAARPSDFEEVRGQVRDALLNEKADQLVKTASEEAGKRAKAGEDLAAIARAYGTAIEKGTDFARLDTIGDLGPATYLEESFREPVGSVIGPKQVQGRYVIAKITKRDPVDMSGLNAERGELLKSLKEARATERNSLWMDSILTAMTASGDVKRNEDEIQRVLAQYRK